LTPDVPQ
jgi:hypothetical protein